MRLVRPQSPAVRSASQLRRPKSVLMRRPEATEGPTSQSRLKKLEIALTQRSALTISQALDVPL